MKLIIDGHIVVVNKMSLYIDGKMEFQAVNMITEYGQKLDGCKYAVASRYSQKRLEELYKENLKKFSPYIYLTEAQYGPIRDFNNNENKHHMRDINNHAGYDFEEELSEVMHDCKHLYTDSEPDALTAIIEREDEALREKLIAVLPEAMTTLTETQKRRVYMFFYDGMTFREIAEIEGTKVAPVYRSIQSAMKKIEDFLKKVS